MKKIVSLFFVLVCVFSACKMDTEDDKTPQNEDVVLYSAETHLSQFILIFREPCYLRCRKQTKPRSAGLLFFVLLFFPLDSIPLCFFAPEKVQNVRYESRLFSPSPSERETFKIFCPIPNIKSRPEILC